MTKGIAKKGYPRHKKNRSSKKEEINKAKLKQEEFIKFELEQIKLKKDIEEKELNKNRQNKLKEKIKQDRLNREKQKIEKYTNKANETVKGNKKTRTKKNTYIRYENKFVKSFDQVIASKLKIYILLLLIMMLSVLLTYAVDSKMSKKSPLEYIINDTYIIFLIIVYYFNIFASYRKLEDQKSIFLNFFGIFSLYNILLIYNPLDMVEVSQEYPISNIFYFYGSFLLISFNNQIFKKLIIFAMLTIKLINFIKKDPKMLVPILIFPIIYGVMLLKLHFILNMTIKIMICVLYLFVTVYVPKKILKNIDNEKIYLKIKDFLSDYAERIIELWSWFMELLHIKDLKELTFKYDDGSLNKKNIIIFLLVKVVLCYALIALYKNNVYYAIYAIKNDGYCKNIDEQKMIIKLKNGNVLIVDEDKKYFKEVDCTKEMKTIEIIK